VGRGVTSPPGSFEFSSPKMQGFMHVIAKSYLWLETETREGPNRCRPPLPEGGGEDVKCMRVENLAMGSTPPTVLSTHTL